VKKKKCCVNLVQSRGFLKMYFYSISFILLYVEGIERIID